MLTNGSVHAKAHKATAHAKMILNSLFDPLWLDADVTLCGGGTAVLQKPLDKGDVIAICLVDFRCIPFAKTVGTDKLKNKHSCLLGRSVC